MLSFHVKVKKVSALETLPLFMGDHGRSTLGHVVAKKSRGYYCPPGRPCLHQEEVWEQGRGGHTDSDRMGSICEGVL